MLDPRTLRGVDRILVVLDAQLVGDGRVGDDQELVGPGEGGVERCGVAVVAPTDLDARVFDCGGCAGGVVQ